MLTDEEKNRIKYEEIFRQEIRLQLEGNNKPSSTWKKVWAIINTSFGIWLLSTIVVGLFTWSYARWEQDRTKQSQRNEVIRKLDIEISSRISSIKSSLNNVSTLYTYVRIMRSLGKPEEFGPISEIIFPEFQNRSLISLMFELLQLVSTDIEKSRINEALKALQRVGAISYEDRLMSKSDKEPLTPNERNDLKEFSEALQQCLKTGRWRTFNH
jgi:hypothetical protein